MDSVDDSAAIPHEEGFVADLSNVICVLEEEDVKPHVSDLSCHNVDDNRLIEEFKKNELFLKTHNSYGNDIKEELSAHDLAIKQENIDHKIRLKPDLIYREKVENQNSKNLEKFRVTSDEEFAYTNSPEKEETQLKGDKPFKCCYCDKAYPRLSHLNRHQRIHTGEKPYKCNFCDKAFSDPSHLKTHQRIHTGEKPFKCSYCDKAFSSSFILNRHRRIHTGEKPFKCNYCDRAFSQSYELNNHLRTHTGEKPFQCNYCDKAFSRSSHLNRHQRIHLKCNSCDKPFPNFGSHQCVNSGDSNIIKENCALDK